ncbi:stretch-activated Ca-permeable channel [Parachaetomium inaequale]|uniref:Stretch-activated Ca-permeable channel n=1 Tax=Parachaetomium inaequale TaxID=2588326 RepID=A0AAN6PKW9_9PEZI|nr:stretch-activated Ca-permeable channel [Parachaetomium inaequale]
MHLSPLQSRLAASLVASCLLILLYLVLFPPNFALAAELNEALPAVFDDFDLPTDPGPRGPPDAMYEPEFSAFDRSILGRAPDGVTSLTNNEPMPMNAEEGSTQNFVFALPQVSERGTEEGRLELRSEDNVSGEGNTGAGATGQEETGEEEGQSLTRRQASRKVYISANTCQQPQPIDPSKTTLDPPQLILFVSTTAANQAPGPLADKGTQDMVVFNEGAVVYSFTTDREVYIGIHAPNVSEAFSGIYNFRVVASVDSYYYSYNKDDLLLVDTDSQGALLVTHNLTDSTDPSEQAAIMQTQPYVFFAHPKGDRAVNGLRYSYCGLENYALIAATKDGRQSSLVKTSMTTRAFSKFPFAASGQGNLPKQQFFLTGLNSSTEYIGILARDGIDRGALGKRQTASERGNEVFQPTDFTTNSNRSNCALVIDLTFCDQVAYSVPSNPAFGNSTRLAEFYDAYASSMYANFDKSLAQVACEAPSSQRYSLARTCADCAAAYKAWLCSVTIPHCEDFSSTADFLQARAVGQPFPNGETLDPATLAKYDNTAAYMASRNSLIDEVIKPGPYKELLPCDDLCYKLVQSCPASLQFGCPQPGGKGFKGNYETRDPSGALRCNFPGSAHFPSAGGRAGVDWGVVVGAVVVGLLVV